LPQWLRARATTLELDIDDDAARFIVERTEGNLLAALQELQKLKMGAGGKRVDLAAVQASIGNSARFDVFQLVKPRSAAMYLARCVSWPDCAAKHGIHARVVVARP
jgi:DNA polymerase III delta subunit